MDVGRGSRDNWTYPLFLFTDMFTVCFAIGRLPGWIAQWKEQHDDPTTIILRPRQVYTGPKESDYLPIEKR